MSKVVRRRGWAVVLLVVGAVVVIAGWGWPVFRVRMFPNALEQGRAAYDTKDWARASKLASARLKELPRDPESIRLLARSNARLGRDDTARTLYTRLGGASEMQAEDFFLLGGMIDRRGDHNTARECWVAGLRADPRNSEILNEFARLYFQEAQFDLAARTATALVGRPGWEARGEIVLGRIAMARDEFALAANHFSRGLTHDPTAQGTPDSPQQNRKRLIHALLGAGKADDADRELKTLLTSHPDPETYWLLSRAKLQAGALREASEALAKSGSYREEHPLDHDPSPYVGSARCASCHHDLFEAQQNSLHAKTFLRDPTARQLPLPKHPLPDPSAPSVTHTFEPAGDRVREQTNDHGKLTSAIVEYVFGSGHRALTLIGRDETAQIRELRLSHYTDTHAWEVTTGHPVSPPAQEGYLGRILSSDDLYACFACHTTTPYLTLEGRGPALLDRAIGCERCHGPGGNHLTAMASKFSDLSIAQPRAVSGAAVVTLCGQCHSPLRQTVARSDPSAPRFPATTLTWSRCYTESNGTFDCRTCHDPHRDLKTSTAHYEAKCVSCHMPARATVCPVDAKTGCVSCHMPKAEIGVPHTEFTDHYIRVHPRTKPR